MKKKYLIILIVVLAALGVFLILSVKRQKVGTLKEKETEEEIEIKTISAEQSGLGAPINLAQPKTKIEKPKDSDKDGLSDEEELKIGTNPEKWDSDDDGLGDREEKELGFDPLKKDSNDDGINDAEAFKLGLPR